MARLHSKKKGKSGSRKPPSRAVPPWVEMSGLEVEELAVKLAKQGVSNTLIGQTMRDTYGIPSITNITGKSLLQILREAGIKQAYPEDLLNLIKRATNVRKHLKANKRDIHNRVKLGHIESKIKRLVRYYRNAGRLPAGWAYDPDKAALLVK